MDLENQLKQVKDLEVGNMEKTITETENSKYDIETISDKRDLAIEEYKILLKEKLPKIIYNFCSWKSIFEIRNLGPINSKENRKYLTLEIKKYEFIDDLVIKIVFEKKTHKIKEISLYDTVWCGFKDFITRSNKYTKKKYLIKSKTPIEFAEKFTDLFFKEWGNDTKDDVLDIIYSMHSVPNKIKEEYSEIVENRKKQNKKINSYCDKLESLDVSDF